MHITGRTGQRARILAVVFGTTSLMLAFALGGSWYYMYKLLRAEEAPMPEMVAIHPAIPEPASLLQVRYELNVPGRGEIFPALESGNASDYWPAAVLSINNQSEHPVVRSIAVEIPGWSERSQQTVLLAPHTTHKLDVTPDLLPRAFDNLEMRRAWLLVKVRDGAGESQYEQRRPVYLHSASDLFWGNKFANAQFIARWVTPHDPTVLRLVAQARMFAPNGRMPGYGNGSDAARLAKQQAYQIFEALKRSRVSYVSSIFTFGDFTRQAQRIRMPEETLTLNTANCIDVSVAFASAVENLGMDPLIVIVPGHAFTGLRLGPNSPERLYLDLTVLPKGTFQDAIGRAQRWLKHTPANQVVAVDIAASRAMKIYPIPEPARDVHVTQSTDSALGTGPAS
jgi:hypothetical protein